MAGCNAWMPLHRRSVDHIYLRSHRNCWTCWTKAHQVMVPTTDTVRSAFLLQTLVLALVYISLFWSLQIVCRWKRSLNAFSSGYMFFFDRGIQWVPCPLLWIDRHWKNGPPVWVSKALICSRLPWSPARLSFSKSCWNASCLDSYGSFQWRDSLQLAIERRGFPTIGPRLWQGQVLCRALKMRVSVFHPMICSQERITESALPWTGRFFGWLQRCHSMARSSHSPSALRPMQIKHRMLSSKMQLIITFQLELPTFFWYCVNSC